MTKHHANRGMAFGQKLHTKIARPMCDEFLARAFGLSTMNEQRSHRLFRATRVFDI
jgi:hypothetical protein